MTKCELYLEFLAEEGYRPRSDEDGDITFRKEGKLYVIIPAEEDPQLFRMCAYKLWPIESDEERVLALEAASTVTAMMKITKLFVLGDNVHASVELLFDSPEKFEPLFDRALGLLDAGVREFGNKMRELAPAASA